MIFNRGNSTEYSFISHSEKFPYLFDSTKSHKLDKLVNLAKRYLAELLPSQETHSELSLTCKM